MATDNPRIQVTLDKQTNNILSLLAKNRSRSKSAVAADMIRKAMELEEDFYLSKIAEKRDTEESVWIEDSDAIWE